MPGLILHLHSLNTHFYLFRLILPPIHEVFFFFFFLTWQSLPSHMNTTDSNNDTSNVMSTNKKYLYVLWSIQSLEEFFRQLFQHKNCFYIPNYPFSREGTKRAIDNDQRENKMLPKCRIPMVSGSIVEQVWKLTMSISYNLSCWINVVSTMASENSELWLSVEIVITSTRYWK